MDEFKLEPEKSIAGTEVSDRLDSWKAIATYLQRDVRTVHRWEKEEGLPVRRHVHHKQASVYAYRTEIDAWLADRGPSLDKGEPGHGFRRNSENRKTFASVAFVVTLFLLAALVAWMDIGSSPNPEGLSFQERDWVLIADFENRTGEPVFDGVLEYALEREIANSQFVNVVPRERIEDTLRLMRKPLDSRIDRTLGGEISLRDGGIKALLTGRVEKLDSTYLLSVELVDPSTAQPIAATSEEAAGQMQVLPALRALSNWARENLGEKLALIQASERNLEKVTTPSLRAVQLFTKAEALIGLGRRSQGPAEELLKQAIDLDPEFASAHIFLAQALRTQGKPAEEYLQYAEKAFQLAETIGNRERYFIHGSYYEMKGQWQDAFHAYEALLSLHPDHFWAVNNLAKYFSNSGQDKRALTYWLRRADLRPNSFRYTNDATYQLLVNGDLARAKTYWGRALDLMTPEDIQRRPNEAIHLMWFPAFEALVHADPETALREADRLLERLRGFERRGLFNYEPTGAFYLTLGKIGLAREWLEKTDDFEVRRHYFLAAIAYAEEDHEAMTEHLKQLLEAWKSLWPRRGSPIPVRNVILLLARGGLLLEAAELLPDGRIIAPGTPDARQEAIERRQDMLRGVLALSRGNRIEGMSMLENALSSSSSLVPATSVYFMGSESLAKAWREQGNSGKAVQVLTAALQKKSHLLVEQSLLTGPLWLRLQAQLVQLYREMGRDEDARKIEDELRRRLALADPDHPILRQLDHTKELALREGAN